MLLAITRTASLRAVPFLTRTPVAQAAVASFPMSHRFKSAMPFAVDGPDGDHDYQEMEESTEWARRTVDVASATEDAAAINDMHDRVLKNQTLFAVDAPDGEHDLEDVEEHMKGVESIIDEASFFEDAEEVKVQQAMRHQTFIELNKISEHDV